MIGTRAARGIVRCCAALAAAACTVPMISPPALAAEHPHRPRVHYTPAENWMNDPNGLVYHDGEYHLYYQHNPEGNAWGNMSWGHAVSPDLVHWEERPLAIPYTEEEHIFSGGVVVDHDNSSGLGTDGEAPMVAVYTSAYTERSEHAGIQAQSLAYSNDGGETWTKYEGNPVLDIGSGEFRDPKVFWYEEGGYWVMAVVVADERVVHFYRSDDLLDWTKLSEFGPAHATGGVWEVPDLFELPVDGGAGGSKWVLVVNLNPGAVAGGSGAQYFVGDFDGVEFTPDRLVTGDDPPEGEVFADFENGYGDWEITNDLDGTGTEGPFGSAPAAGTLPGQQPVDGHRGGHLMNGFVDGDAPRGEAASPAFTIERDYINLLVGGGDNPRSDTGDTSVNLVVDGEVVRTATGRDSEHLDWTAWNVSEYRGRTAHIRVRDDASDGWGHVLLDHIMFSDAPARSGLENYDWLDHGRDYYAAVSYNDAPDDERIMLGWMNNWDYAGDIPTSPWRGAMSLPRRLELATLDGRPQLVQRPVDQLASLRGDIAYSHDALPLDGGERRLPPRAEGEVFELDVELDPETADEIGLTVRQDGTTGTVIGYDARRSRLFVDRERSGDVGFNSAFPSRSSVAVDPGATLELRVVVDTSSVEVFAEGGSRVLTHRIFPGAEATGISLYAEGGRGYARDLSVRPLNPYRDGTAQ
ncbi:glycoside hydrolase family 32 protein [Nocardiopsis suaedae]|uniref:Glycoside hydrolase family 32 protein n=1 Tax=Nocardiopsis suaedae TaxID=3018444 RepID=A0ABT4TMN9_9ACTN|nr:glycoside hydrolase family 32 protein [Nocardiopsis suaedae]MDA2805519.1 glycoside hydrolase family 32 protein [Nocardiopsis suaedae]